MEKTYSKADLARLMNEWMRRYVENPTQFEAEFNTVSEFRSDVVAEQVPTYGTKCANYLAYLDTELSRSAQ